MTGSGSKPSLNFGPTSHSPSPQRRKKPRIYNEEQDELSLDQPMWKVQSLKEDEENHIEQVNQQHDSERRNEGKDESKDESQDDDGSKDEENGKNGDIAEPSSIKLLPHATPQPATSISSAPSTALSPTPPRQFRVVDKVGDLFNAPPGAVLIHACNCLGFWGAGIAAAFQKKYPHAYQIQNAHCRRSLPQRLVGTALLIAPRDGTPPARRHYVGCVFTSKGCGRARDTPEMILRATGPAMRDLLEQIAAERAYGEDIGEIRMCRINSGLFAVPWTESKRAIEEVRLDEEDIASLPGDIFAYNPT